MRKKINENKDCECGCEGDCKCGEDCSCREEVQTEGQQFTFDKFMDSIVLKESKRVPAGDSLIRERAKRHQERPLGRIRFGGGK